MSKLAKLLSLPEMADRLASAGRGKDSILAHINPTEARLLKSRGGSGKRNPSTGIVEFDDYSEDPNAGEAEAQANMAPPPTSYAPAAQDPAQQQQAEAAKIPAPVEEPKQGAFLPNPPETTGQVPPGATPVGQGYAGPITATSTKTPAVDMQNVPANVAADYAKQMKAGGGGFIEGLKNFGNELGDLNKALSPAAPWLKGAGALATAVQGNKASEQAQQQAAANEAEIRKLADPYKQRGQQLIELGQAGGLTSTQQKQLEVQRAVASQQMASSGVTGGTAQQQLEANLQQQAAAFAQQNIDQGMKLMGISDEYIMKAMNTGYAESKDAQSLAMDFYKAIGQFLEPEAKTSTPQQANAAPK